MWIEMDNQLFNLNRVQCITGPTNLDKDIILKIQYDGGHMEIKYKTIEEAIKVKKQIYALIRPVKLFI